MHRLEVTMAVIVSLGALLLATAWGAYASNQEGTGDKQAADDGLLELAEAQGLRERRFRRAAERWKAKAEESGAEQLKIAGRTVLVWRPPAAQQNTRPAPVILFSHGLHGCSTQSTFLTSALAQHGYVVVAPNHADAFCGRDAISAKGMPPEEKLRDPESWSDATYRGRADDILAVIDGLKTDASASAWIDWSRIGLMGHSLGGYTVLGLAGAWPSWRLANAKAVLALSPYCAPFADHGALQSLGVPAMYQGGTRDLGITPSVKRPGGCFDSTQAPAYFVELAKAGHFAWTDLKADHQANITAYAIAFFDKYLAGSSTTELTARRSDVSELRAK